MSFQDDLMIAEAIREIRARGCTTPGVAERIVKHHGHHHVHQNLHRVEQLLEEIFREDKIIAEEIRHLLERLAPLPASSTLTILNSKGENMLTVHVNDTPGTAVYQEFSGLRGTGQKVPPTGAVVYKSDNPSVATVDPSTGDLAYLSAGSATISADDGGNLPASDVLTVTAAAAASSTLTLNPGASSV